MPYRIPESEKPYLFFYLLAALLLYIPAHLVFSLFWPHSHQQAERMVPESAVVSVHLGSLAQAPEALYGAGQHWTVLQVPLFASLATQTDDLWKWVAAGPLPRSPYTLASLHRTSGQEFEWIFYLELPLEADRTNDAWEQPAPLAPLTEKERYYQKIPISKVSTAKSSGFSFAIVRGVMLVSRSEFLIEEVIRNAGAPSASSLLAGWWPSSTPEPGTVQIKRRNWAGISRWVTEKGLPLSQFWPELPPFLLQIEQLSFFSRADSLLTLSAKATLSKKNTHLLASRSTYTHLDSLMTARDAGGCSFAVPAASPYPMPEWDPQLKNLSGATLSEWWESVGSEAGYVLIPKQKNKLAWVFFAHLAEEKEGWLESAFSNLAPSSPASVKVGKEVVPVWQIPALQAPGQTGALHNLIQVLWPQYFSTALAAQGWHTVYRGYWLAAESPQLLNQLLADLQSGRRRLAVSPQAYAPAHLRLRPEMAWDYLTAALNGQIRQKANQYKRYWLSLGQLSIAVRGEKELLADLLFSATPAQSSPAEEAETSATALWADVSQGPALLASGQVLVQTKDLQLRLFEPEGKQVWRQTLPTAPAEGIYAVDFYQNERWQLLYAAGGQIFLTDRLSRQVNGFPFQLPAGSQAKHLAAFYEGAEQNWRIVCTDQYGRAFVFSRYGTLLPDWKPRNLSESLAFRPESVKVEDNDYLLFVSENGLVHLLDMQARSAPGFPVHLRTPLTKQHHLQKSAALQTHLLHLISTAGELIVLDLTGKIRRREKLPRSGPETIHAFITEPNQSQEWAFVSQYGQQITVSSPSGEKLFSHELEKSKLASVQFFRVAPQTVIYGIHQPSERTAMLFHSNGEPLLPEPIASDRPLALSQRGNGLFTLVAVYQRKIWFYPVSLK